MLVIGIAMLQGSAAHAQTINPQKRIVGCWDSGRTDAASPTLCFDSKGRFAQTNPERKGSYRFNGRELAISLNNPAASSTTLACGFEFDPTQNRIKSEGRTVTVSWARAGSWLKLTSCDVSGQWLKSCDKLELAYGTCPRKTNATATD
jgi:hypothetical protein